MFKKLFRKSAPVASPTPQPVAEVTEEEPSMGVVMFHAEKRIADMESRYYASFSDQDQLMERQLLLERQEVIMEVLEKYSAEVVQYSYWKSFLSSAYRFSLDASDWASRWEQDCHVYEYEELSEVATALEEAIEKLNGFLVMDRINLEVGVSPAQVYEARRSTEYVADRAVIDVLTHLLDAYLSLSDHPSFMPPQVGKYWGWTGRYEEGGWNILLTAFKAPNGMIQFITKDNKPFIQVREVRDAMNHMMR